MVNTVMLYTKILLFTGMLLIPNIHERVLFDCEVFTVNNESSYALGDVQVSGTGGSGDVEVPETGVYADTLCFTPSAIEINGEVSSYPTTTTIILASGSAVQVTWESTQLVDITNEVTRDGLTRP